MRSPLLPFPDKVEEVEPALSLCTSKCWHRSTDFASEPPSPATSYSSYHYNYSTSGSSATSPSQRSSMDFASHLARQCIARTEHKRRARTQGLGEHVLPPDDATCERFANGLYAPADGPGR